MMMKPDLTLIQEFTEDDLGTEGPVQITKFKRDGKILLYVDASHELGTKNPTCETIRLAISRFHPEFIVLEANTSGTAYKNLVDHTKQQAKSNFQYAYEFVYAAHLAVQHKIPFYGGEPTLYTLASNMQEHGYSTDDFTGFYLARTTTQWR